jgi:hypothetical protein
MARHQLLTALLVGSSVFVAAPGEAARRSYELGYFLPAGVANAKVAQRLVSCPRMDPGNRFVAPVFDYRVVIDAKTLPEPRLIKVDANNGFLAKRSTELKLRPDGTLESFNATNEGQAAAVISAVIKTVASVASTAMMGIGPASEALPYDCTQKVKDDLEARERIEGVIARLEDQIAEGDASPGAVAELARQRAALQTIEDRLTVTTSGDRIYPAHGQTGGTSYIKPTDASRFFEPATSARSAAFLAAQPGANGYLLTWTANAPLQQALGAGQVGALPTKATPFLYYRRPVPARIEVAPCKAPPSAAKSPCAKDESPEAEALQSSGNVSFPQLSGFYYIPIGRGGLFGSEEAIAEFDATGAPTRLKYGSDPGAAGLTSVIDAAREGYTTLDGAKAAASQAHLDDLKRRKEIRELEDELSKPLPASAPAATQD